MLKMESALGDLDSSLPGFVVDSKSLSLGYYLASKEVKRMLRRPWPSLIDHGDSSWTLLVALVGQRTIMNRWRFLLSWEIG